MKKNCLMLQLLWVLFNLFTITPTAQAQNLPSTADQREYALSGSDLKSEDIALKCNAVFIGKIVELGDPVPAAAGVASFSGVEVKVLQVLRGSIDGEIIKVTLRTKSGQNIHEMPPQVGNTYVFFVHANTEKGWNPYTVLKLLSATDATTAKIKSLMVQNPK